jgi:hypothetical protein
MLKSVLYRTVKAAALGSVLMLAACAEVPNHSLTGPSGLTGPGSDSLAVNAIAPLGKPGGLNAGLNGPETLPVPVVTADVSVCEQVSISWTNAPTTPSGFVATSWHIMLFVWDEATQEWIQVSQDNSYAQTSFQASLEPGLYQFRVRPNGQGPDTNYNGGFVETEFTVTACAALSCSPGFWKNLTQHASYWQVYAPGTEFSTVFGRSITVGAGGQNTITDPNLTEALQATGGGDSRTARVGTAALLSAAHANLTYPYSIAEVIAAVQNAIDGIAGPISIDDLENVWKLSPLPQHCPLGNDPIS